MLRVYPRVCGGTQHPRPSNNDIHGLSPRVRGNLVSRGHVVGWIRSIPACAGEPKCRCANWSASGVYPRVCGGTRRPGRALGHRLGLSPRVRGNHDRLVERWRDEGSIPACAGEPLSCWPWVSRCTVYPRVCGGTEPTDEGAEIVMGLSPRVRGNLQLPDKGVVLWGSIPACAGEPSVLAQGAGDQPVYPRVCGGTLQYANGRRAIFGLSPRVRGNPILGSSPRSLSRSIPACAGEPKTL